MRPLIGITCSRLVGGSWGLYSRGHFIDYTFAEYSQAVLAVGGAPVLIPVAQNTESRSRTSSAPWAVFSLAAGRM